MSVRPPSASLDYRYASIDDLAALLRSRGASASELAAEAVRLVGEIGRRYNAVATVLEDRASIEAAAADRTLAAGPADGLCGIPYAVKDLFAATGGPTTWGSPAFRDQVFARDALVVARLAQRGATLVAKLAMSELAGGGEPSRAGASLHGQGRNPWDPDRYAGGSSSGSGIAVALGLVPFALGTETGGSIVGPAAFTGVTGMRPTFGLVPRRGVMTLAWSLDKVGPLARNAVDCGTVLDAVTSRWKRPEAERFANAAREPDRWLASSVRAAFSPAELDEASETIRPALEEGLAALRGELSGFVEAEIDRDPRFIAALEEIVRVEGSFEFRDHFARPDFRMTDEQQQAKLSAGLTVPAMDYLEADRTVRRAASRAFTRVFRSADIIVSASRPAIAPSLTGTRPPRDASKLSDLLRAAANLAGLPGISIPCGLSTEGMPVGLHVLGPRGSDALLLAVAGAFQRSTSYHRLRPPDMRAPSDR